MLKVSPIWQLNFCSSCFFLSQKCFSEVSIGIDSNRIQNACEIRIVVTSCRMEPLSCSEVTRRCWGEVGWGVEAEGSADLVRWCWGLEGCSDRDQAGVCDFCVYEAQFCCTVTESVTAAVDISTEEVRVFLSKTKLSTARMSFLTEQAGFSDMVILKMNKQSSSLISHTKIGTEFILDIGGGIFG